MFGLPEPPKMLSEKAAKAMHRRELRDKLVVVLAPEFVAEFHRTGGVGETWMSHKDLAQSMRKTIEAIVEEFT